MNKKGIAEVAILIYVIAALALFFVPNPVSSSLGIGIRPNKTVEKVELINDKNGVPIAYKTTEQDIQQHVGFWEWLRSLPIMVVMLMGAGVIFPGLGIWLHSLWSKAVAEYKDLSGETKRIVISIKAGLATITDQSTKDKFLAAVSQQQDQSTKDLVKELLKGS